MERNILLTIAYDGSEFHGWQRQPQPEVRTVQGYLEQTLSRLFGREIQLNGTSRTDAGVHALGQRASFRTDVSIPIERLARVCNNALCGREEGSFALSPVRILEAKEMPPEFHARFDSRGKKYVYRILPGGSVDLFRRNYVYHVKEELDTEAMQAAAQRLVGTHDFKSFESAGGTPRETTVRTIFDARVLRGDAAPGPAVSDKPSAATEPMHSTSNESADTAEPGHSPSQSLRNDEIRLEISGDGFLYNMVRIITGTLVEVGQGKRDPEEITRIIEAVDRTQAGHTAPPYGLYLAEVYYE